MKKTVKRWKCRAIYNHHGGASYHEEPPEFEAANWKEATQIASEMYPDIKGGWVKTDDWAWVQIDRPRQERDVELGVQLPLPL